MWLRVRYISVGSRKHLQVMVMREGRSTIWVPNKAMKLAARLRRPLLIASVSSLLT
jgi:hypothetical protein